MEFHSILMLAPLSGKNGYAPSNTLWLSVITVFSKFNHTTNRQIASCEIQLCVHVHSLHLVVWYK